MKPMRFVHLGALALSAAVWTWMAHGEEPPPPETPEPVAAQPGQEPATASGPEEIRGGYGAAAAEGELLEGLLAFDEGFGTWMDEEPQTLVAGIPQHFFPFGIYMAGHNDPANLEKVRRAGFDLVIDYQWGEWGSTPSVIHPEAGQYLDRLGEARLKVLWALPWYLERPNSWSCTHPGFPDIPDCHPPNQAKLNQQVTNFVTFLRDRPEVFGYYIADEPNLSLPKIPIPTLDQRYGLVRALDPTRPILQVFAPGPTQGANQGPEWSQYKNGLDVLGVDPYPLIDIGPAKPLRMVYDAVVGARNAATSGRRVPHWAVIQAHAGGNYWPDYPNDLAPTLDELQNMVVQALAARTEGLFFYSHFDCFRSPTDPGPNPELFRTCFANVSAAAANARHFAEVTIDGQDVSLPALTANEDVKVRAVEYRGRLFIAVVNVSETATREILYRLPVADWNRLTSLTGATESRIFGVDKYNKKISVKLKPKGYDLFIVEKGTQAYNRIVLVPWDADQRQDVWFTDGAYAYTWWGNKWFEYVVYVPHDGAWNVRAFARQAVPAKLPPGYSFQLRVDVDGKNKGIMTIPGAGFFREGAVPVSMSRGYHRVRLTWTNDVYQPPYDSNVMLSRVVIDDGSPALAFRPAGKYHVDKIRCGNEPLGLEGQIRNGVLRNEMTFTADGKLVNRIIRVQDGAVTFSDRSWIFFDDQSEWRTVEEHGNSLGYRFELFHGGLEPINASSFRLVAPVHPLCASFATSTLEITLVR